MHWLEIVGRAAAVYAFLLVGLRIAGKRELGQMTAFDLVVVLILANAVQNAMVGQDTSLLGGLVAAGTLLAINFVVATLRVRWKHVEHLLIGTPTRIIENGRYLDHNIEREDLDREQVCQALREHGIEDVEHVKLAVLEIDGTISVVPRDPERAHRKRKVRLLKHARV